MSATAYSHLAESNVFLLEKTENETHSTVISQSNTAEVASGLKKAESSSLFTLNSVFPLSTMWAQDTVGKQEPTVPGSTSAQ